MGAVLCLYGHTALLLGKQSIKFPQTTASGIRQQVDADR